jgi:cation diffusion facilitator CzcD-associated flavoprotein CzcO
MSESQVVIVGAGPAGLAAALALKDLDIRFATRDFPCSSWARAARGWRSPTTSRRAGRGGSGYRHGHRPTWCCEKEWEYLRFPESERPAAAAA